MDKRKDLLLHRLFYINLLHDLRYLRLPKIDQWISTNFITVSMFVKTASRIAFTPLLYCSNIWDSIFTCLLNWTNSCCWGSFHCQYKWQCQIPKLTTALFSIFLALWAYLSVLWDSTRCLVWSVMSRLTLNIIYRWRDTSDHYRSRVSSQRVLKKSCELIRVSSPNIGDTLPWSFYMEYASISYLIMPIWQHQVPKVRSWCEFLSCHDM